MSDELKGKKIAILAADGVERVELEQPRQAVENAGATTELISLEAGEIQAMDHDLQPARKFAVDTVIADVSPDDYDGLILPGGVANPDNLRQDDDVIAFLQAFFKSGKPVGVICHGPWTLVEADLVRGLDADVVSEHSHRYPQRRRKRRRRRGRGRSGDSCPRVTPMTCRRSAPRSSRSSPRAPTMSPPQDATAA